MPRKSAISLTSDGCALPEKTFRSPNPVDINPSPLRGRLITLATRHGWLGREDSNLRIREPKSRALPLGHAPPRRPTAQVVQTLSVVEPSGCRQGPAGPRRHRETETAWSFSP